MPLLKNHYVQFRRMPAPSFMREVYAKLATAHAFGSSFAARYPRLLKLIRARMENPKYIIAPGSIPPTPKIAKITAPGVHRKKKRKGPRPPWRSEPKEMFRDSGEKAYLRLTNGQIIRTRQGTRFPDNIVAMLPGGRPLTLKPSDQALLTAPSHV